MRDNFIVVTKQEILVMLLHTTVPVNLVYEKIMGFSDKGKIQKGTMPKS